MERACKKPGWRFPSSDGRSRSLIRVWASNRSPATCRACCRLFLIRTWKMPTSVTSYFLIGRSSTTSHPLCTFPHTLRDDRSFRLLPHISPGIPTNFGISLSLSSLSFFPFSFVPASATSFPEGACVTANHRVLWGRFAPDSSGLSQLFSAVAQHFHFVTRAANSCYRRLINAIAGILAHPTWQPPNPCYHLRQSLLPIAPIERFFLIPFLSLFAWVPRGVFSAVSKVPFFRFVVVAARRVLQEREAIRTSMHVKDNPSPLPPFSAFCLESGYDSSLGSHPRSQVIFQRFS